MALELVLISEHFKRTKIKTRLRPRIRAICSEAFSHPINCVSDVQILSAGFRGRCCCTFAQKREREKAENEKCQKMASISPQGSSGLRMPNFLININRGREVCCVVYAMMVIIYDYLNTSNKSALTGWDQSGNGRLEVVVVSLERIMSHMRDAGNLVPCAFPSHENVHEARLILNPGSVSTVLSLARPPVSSRDMNIIRHYRCSAHGGHEKAKDFSSFAKMMLLVCRWNNIFQA